MQLLSHTVSAFFSLERNCQTLPEWLLHFSIPIINVCLSDPIPPHPHQHLVSPANYNTGNLFPVLLFLRVLSSIRNKFRLPLKYFNNGYFSRDTFSSLRHFPPYFSLHLDLVK